MRHEPHYAPFYELEAYQVARFLRDDSLRVVGATDVSGTELTDHAPVEVAVVLDRSPGAEPTIAWAEPARTSGAAELAPGEEATPGARAAAPARYVGEAAVDARRHLVSLEVMGEEEGAGRIRKAIGPPELGAEGRGPPTCSSSSGPATFQETAGLDDVRPHALGAERVDAEAPAMGIYWESYGLEAGDVVEVRVRVVEAEPSLARRLGRRLGLAWSETALELGWTDEVDEDAPLSADGEEEAPLTIWPRNLHLDLSGLETGDCRVRVTVEPDGREPLTAERPLGIVDRRHPLFLLACCVGLHVSPACIRRHRNICLRIGLRTSVAAFRSLLRLQGSGSGDGRHLIIH